mgnify:CR=1 FL=1
MPEIHYVGGGITSSSVDILQPVLVKVPGTDVLRVTPTYANQALCGYQIVMTLGDTKKIATAIMSDAGNSTLEERLGVQSDLEALRKEVEELKASNYRRAQPFLQYAQEGGSRNYEIVRKIQSGEELTFREIDALVDMVPSLRRFARARLSTKDAVRDYIRSGETDDQTLFWLARTINPIYGKVIEYNSLNARIQQIDQAYTNLEQALVQSIDAIKAGNKYQEEIVVGDTRINVRERLKQLTGAEPGRYFLLTIDEVVEGENKDGLIVPFQYNARNGTNVPEELKPYYMPVDKLGQIITLFDRALANILIVYARENQEIVKISGDYTAHGIFIMDGVFVRAMFPEDHAPTLTLYSDARLKITNDEDGRKMMNIVKNERARIPSIVAEYFEIPEEQIKFEELISLQAQLMQLLPMQAYICAETSARFSFTADESKKYRSRLKPTDHLLMARYQTHNNQLQRDFNVSQERITNRTRTEATLKEVIHLFGEEFDFIGKIKLKEGDE